MESIRPMIITDFEDSSVYRLQKYIYANMQKSPYLVIMINSLGGDVYNLFAMAEYLRLASIYCEVITHVPSVAMSAASALFTCGNRRFVGPKASLMIHEVATSIDGYAKDVKIEVEETEKVQQNMFSMMDENCCQKNGYFYNLVQECNTDLYLSPKDCLKHNLCTEIGVPYIDEGILYTIN